MLFWIVAALLVSVEHVLLAHAPASLAAAAEALTIFGVAFLYMRFAAREATVDHALGAGVLWLLLAIVTELAMTSHLHHEWYSLLGSRAHPLIRNLILFVWIFAPVIFARRTGVE